MALAAVLAGCGEKQAGPPPRYAVVRFENLSGDAGLEWTGRAASELLAQSLSGAMDGPVIATTALNRMGAALGVRPGAAPGLSSDRVSAQISGATRMISGYVQKTAAGVRATAVEDDLTTGKRLLTVSFADGDAMKALTGLARAISPKAGAYATSNEEAFRLYCVAREARVDDAAVSLEGAVQRDPAFGPAWEALVQIETAKGDRQGAESLIARARQQKLSPLSMANLDLEAAILQGDQKARLVALKKVSSLSPADTVLTRSLAETESQQGQFAEAAADWKRLREVLPNDADVWNQLGYNLAWSGDYAGAVQTMEGYVKMRPGDANPLDSLGDVHFMNRKFAEAAKAYQEVCTKYPQFQNGADFYKAAWAKYRAGDKAGAEASFAEFRKARQNTSGVTSLYGDWLYRTGRTKEAVAELRKAMGGENVPPADKAMWAAQLTVWDLLGGDRTTAAADIKAAGIPNTPVSVLAFFAATPSGSAAEWEARAARMIPGPAASQIRNLALGYALALDGKKAAARAPLKQVIDTTPGTDFGVRVLYAGLNGEQPKLELVPEANAINPFAVLGDKQAN